MALYYLSTAADAVRFDTPTYQLYVGGGVPGAPLGYVGPFVSLSGIVQVYMTGSSGFNPETFKQPIIRQLFRSVPPRWHC